MASSAYLCLLVVHWFADFVVQTRWQAVNKSKNVFALLLHVCTYTLVFATASVFLFGPVGFIFALLNGTLHFATDYYTSRWSSRLYVEQDWYGFFIVIGFDQLIHQITIALTMGIL